VAGRLGYPGEASDLPPGGQAADLATALEALERERAAVDEPTEHRAASEPQVRIVRGAAARQALCVLLGGVLFGGVVAVVEIDAHDARLSASPGAAARANVVFGNADAGSCLSWPKNAPDKPSFVQCSDDHMFEVAESIDMSNVEVSCDSVVRRYLGNRYDPNSKFSVSALWSGDAAGTPGSERHLLCGLQLPGPDNQPIPFKGRVAELDQSKVWPPGTCLGIDAAIDQPTDFPVDCKAPHAVELTGAVNLAERFPGPPPSPAEQDAFIRDACTRTTEAYLAPIPLHATALVLNHREVSAASWAAGSRQVSCAIGATKGDQGWAPLTGSAKGELSINGQAPLAHPSSPAPAPIGPDERPDAEPTAVDTPTTVPTQQRPGAAVIANSTPSPTTAASSAPAAPLGPPPGPPPDAVPSPTPEPPPAQVIEIPGLPPITLPVFPPPAAPPPAAPPPAA
jgi:Septum formation